LALTFLHVLTTLGFALLPPPSRVFGVLILISFAASYFVDGIVLGILVPSARWLPQVVAAAGIAIGSEYSWPYAGAVQARVASGIAACLWIAAFLHLGTFAGNRIGSRYGYHPVPRASLIDYLEAVALVAVAAAAKVIAERVVQK
jgi:hypothetical protein